MLDRSIAPQAGEIRYSPIQEAKESRLKNNIPLFTINAGLQPVFKLELQVLAGIWYEPKQAISWLTAKMLLEGTKTRSGRDISSSFDRLGAFIEVSAGFDDISIAVFGVTKTFDEVVALLMEVLYESVFPQESIDRLKSLRKDQLRLNDQKNDMYASKKMREVLYGLDYPYGRALQMEQIDALTREDVVDYYENYLFNQPRIYLSGQIDSSMLAAVKANFSNIKTLDRGELRYERKSTQHDCYVERPDSLQTSIRLAWDIPNKGTDGYFDYLLANTFLGGYFGSRLMKNIREEKGYTYGISSYPIHLDHGSFGVISTDVKAEHAQDTLDEIKKEIDALQQHGVSDEEIEAVSNYLAGTFLAGINTPFQLMKMFQKVSDFGLGYDYYESYFEALKAIQSADIRAAVGRYFDMDKVYTAIVGLKK
ncbi:M16 family metallopeptidase [Reichenbachiella agariperforans]|uniref:M16 family metallopeptidase n=1 Tax=Reichenbachiella agariperforans TaxID=156994 RepID=UPI001C09C3BB|nr:pitrilysin family protein [Reichenbachiella agariperforans]MBU2915543.1 insulinase family protein [Reichenbachiella agariperforans]